MTAPNSTRSRRPWWTWRTFAIAALAILAAAAFAVGYAIGHRGSAQVKNVSGTGLDQTATVVQNGQTVLSIGGNAPTTPPPKGPGKVDVATTTRPNVVVILTDDQRYDTLWAMPQVQNLLVDHGVTFSNAFVSNSFCCPSRATILTGSYSHTTGIYGNVPPHGGAPDFRKYGDDKSTIATWLSGDGYDTALFGKYLNDYHGPYIPPGWTHWDAFDYGFRYYGFDAYTNNPKLCAGGRSQCRVDYSREEYSTTVFGEAAAQFIRSAPAAKPLFVYYAPYAPHEPDVPADQYANRFQNLPVWRPPNFDKVSASQPAWVRKQPPLKPKQVKFVSQFRRRQYATLLSVDDEVGSIVDALRATHRLANTMIVFASDNGLAWGAHRFPAAEKRLPYDEATRIPLVVRYDPLTKTPGTDSHLVLNLDWAPTFAALAGASHPKVEGTSFLPLLHGGSDPAWRTWFLLEHWDGSPPTLAPTYCGIRSTRYLYVRYGTGEQELYDQQKDPYDLHNVVNSPAYAAALAQQKAHLMRACRPPPPGYKLP